MRTSALVSTACLLAAAASAQSVVVPAQLATNRPVGTPWYTANVFYSTSSTTVPHDSRTQMMYATSDIAVPAGVWNSMDVRRPGQNAANSYLGNNNPATTTNLVLTISVSPTALAGMTTTFATNHGPTPLTVFNGPLNLPARTGTNVWPQPWENIPFTTPMVYVGIPGGTLVVDATQTGNAATTPWYLEGQFPKNGLRDNNGSAPSSCRFSNNNYNNSLSHTNPRIGATWRVTYNSLLPNVSGFAWIGGQGVGGNYGGLTLPIDLGPLGAPGCTVNASVDYAIGLTASATGSAGWPVIPVPNNPSLSGQSFFDHSLWLDSAANAFGVVVGWSSKWTIGDGLGAPAALLSATGANAVNPTGSIARETGITLQFNN